LDCSVRAKRHTDRETSFLIDMGEPFF
jgi:hypothetical protein